MKQLEVSILGQVYTLGCPDGAEALLQAAVATVDREMVTIRDSGKVKARERIAVLAALNVAYLLAERSIDKGADRVAPASSASGTGAAGIDIDALVQRVDAALGDDGQLL